MPNYFTETCSGSEAGSYLRLTDCVSHNSRLESHKAEEKKPRLYHTFASPLFRANREHLGRAYGLYTERQGQGQNLALTVLYVPYSLDNCLQKDEGCSA